MEGKEGKEGKERKERKEGKEGKRKERKESIRSDGIHNEIESRVKAERKEGRLAERPKEMLERRKAKPYYGQSKNIVVINEVYDCHSISTLAS